MLRRVKTIVDALTIVLDTLTTNPEAFAPYNPADLREILSRLKDGTIKRNQAYKTRPQKKEISAISVQRMEIIRQLLSDGKPRTLDEMLDECAQSENADVITNRMHLLSVLKIMPEIKRGTTIRERVLPNGLKREQEYTTYTI